MTKKRNTTYLLIENKDGKFNYSNKGFVDTPHYISLVTAKYRAKDIVKSAHRWFDPKDKYCIERVRDLLKMKIRYYNLDSHGQMLLEPAMPEMDLYTFADAENMQDVVGMVDYLRSELVKLDTNKPN